MTGTQFARVLSSPLVPGQKHACPTAHEGANVHMQDYVTRRSKRLTLKCRIIMPAFQRLKCDYLPYAFMLGVGGI